MLEDVTTKGGSVKAAITAVQSAGCEVVKVLTIVDRQQGAAENLKASGIILDHLFTKDEIFPQ